MNKKNVLQQDTTVTDSALGLSGAETHQTLFMGTDV